MIYIVYVENDSFFSFGDAQYKNKKLVKHILE